MNLGNKILKIRKDNKMSQEQFAEILNVTRQTVSNWENGNNYPDIETLITISDKFNIPLDILLKGDKEMIKDLNNKIKNNKILKRIIICLIIVIIILIAGVKIYETIIHNINSENATYSLTKKCNYNGKTLKLMAIAEQDCNYKYRKWYEKRSCDTNLDKKPISFMIVDTKAKKQEKELMEKININLDDYDNNDDLLKAMEDYIISIGGTCNNS